MELKIAVIRLSLTREDRCLNNDVHLGLWCLSELERDDQELLTSKVIPYSLGGGEFHREAKKATDECYRILLPIISKALNDKSTNNYPIKFWEIIVGSWLRQYVDILYERYSTLLNAKDELNGDVEVALIGEKYETIPFDSDKYSVALFSDKLNHQIYGQIIKARNLFKSVICLNSQETNHTVGRKKRNKYLLKFAGLLSQFIAQNGQVLITKSYLDYKVLLSGVIDRIWVPLIYCPKYYSNNDDVDREGRRVDFSTKKLMFDDDFTKLALELLGRNIPIVFYEELNNLLKEAYRTLPKKMKILITANPNALGELGKCWVAIRGHNNSCKYYVMQHGSNYGQSEVITDEDVELAVSTKYLSGGWGNDKCSIIDNTCCVSRLSGIGAFRDNKTPIKSNNQFLLILASMPRYYYTGWSAPQGPMFERYLSNLSSLYKYLEDDTKNKIVCRDYTYDYGWNDKEYLTKIGFKFPKEGRRKSLNGLMKNSALNIFTYNSTAVMEAFASNYISCCYWDPEDWTWRRGADNDLAMLEGVEIYHRSVESLANFLNKHRSNDSLMEWWSSDDVQYVKNTFCKKYASSMNNEIEKWARIINNGETASSTSGLEKIKIE